MKFIVVKIIIVVCFFCLSNINYSNTVRLNSQKSSAIIAKITYDANVKQVIIDKCSPCQLSTGDETSYDDYVSAKEGINEIIDRIKLQPGQHGFMPQKAPKLSDSLIHIFEQWKVDSLLEK